MMFSYMCSLIFRISQIYISGSVLSRHKNALKPGIITSFSSIKYQNIRNKSTISWFKYPVLSSHNRHIPFPVDYSVVGPDAPPPGSCLDNQDHHQYRQIVSIGWDLLYSSDYFHHRFTAAVHCWQFASQLELYSGLIWQLWQNLPSCFLPPWEPIAKQKVSDLNL